MSKSLCTFRVEGIHFHWIAFLRGCDGGYYRNGGQGMNKITPFLWFNNNAEDATEWVSSWHSLRTAGWS
jgi:hypothetical protein